LSLLNAEPLIKNLHQGVVVYRITSGTDIEQYADRDFARVDVTHELIVDYRDCGLNQVVGSIG